MNKYYRTEGRYNLLSSENQAQYVFQLRDDAPDEIKRSFLIDLDKDGMFSGSPLEVARDIKDVLDSYWIHGSQERIKLLVDYLERWEDADTYDSLIEERDKLTKRLSEVEAELAEYEVDSQ